MIFRIFFQALSVLRPLRFINLFVQSCQNDMTMRFYHRLGFKDIPYTDVNGLYYIWKECCLMKTSFDTLMNKLDSHFIACQTDEDIIFILDIDGAPRSFSQIDSKVEKQEPMTELVLDKPFSKLSYEQIIDAVSSDDSKDERSEEHNTTSPLPVELVEPEQVTSFKTKRIELSNKRKRLLEEMEAIDNEVIKIDLQASIDDIKIQLDAQINLLTSASTAASAATAAAAAAVTEERKQQERVDKIWLSLSEAEDKLSKRQK